MKCPPFNNTSHSAMISSSGRNLHKSFRRLSAKTTSACFLDQATHLYSVLTALCTCLFPSGYHDICNDLFMSLWAVWGRGPCHRFYYNHFTAPDTLEVCLFTEFTKLFYLGVFVLLVLLPETTPTPSPIAPELVPSFHLDSSLSAGSSERSCFPFLNNLHHLYLYLIPRFYH